MEKKELIDAGIILPSSHSSCRDDLSSLGSSTEENDYKESNKPAKKIPRLPAYDWWSPVTSSSFDGSNDAEIFRTLFKRKSSDKRRSNLLGRSLLTNDRRISLIASPSSTTTKLSLSRSTQPFLTEDAITSRNCSSSKTSFLNSNKSLNPQSFYGSSVNGFDKIRNALNLKKLDSSDTSDDSDSFIKNSLRKWAPVHPASLLGNKTRECDDDN